MKFVFTTNARKTLAKLDHQLIQRIFKKIDFWVESGKPMDYAKKVEGHDNLFRFRVGDYRILASPEIEKDQIRGKRIAHRKEVYKLLNKLI